jgi:flagellar protein FliS
MLQAYAKSQYEEMQVQTTPGRLVVMLYDGALRFLQIGKEALCRGDHEGQGLNLAKAQNIICELLDTLDPSAGDLAAQLDAVYRHWLQRLLIANAEDRADFVDEVVQQMRSLRDAWDFAERTMDRPGCLDEGCAPVLVGAGR